MGALSDLMLDGGCVTHIARIHGEAIRILTGAQAGQTFYCTGLETQSDDVLSTELGEDRRGKRTVRFQDSNAVPDPESQCEVQTEDGKRWKMVRAPQDGYLTTDFELQQIADGKDS